MNPAVVAIVVAAVQDAPTPYRLADRMAAQRAIVAAVAPYFGGDQLAASLAVAPAYAAAVERIAAVRRNRITGLSSSLPAGVVIGDRAVPISAVAGD